MLGWGVCNLYKETAENIFKHPRFLFLEKQFSLTLEKDILYRVGLEWIYLQSVHVQNTAEIMESKLQT